MYIVCFEKVQNFDLATKKIVVSHNISKSRFLQRPQGFRFKTSNKVLLWNLSFSPIFIFVAIPSK